MEPKTDTCPKCKSKNTVRHTDKKLRERKVYAVQCFDCKHLWEISWAEDLARFLVQHIIKEDSNLVNGEYYTYEEWAADLVPLIEEGIKAYEQRA